MLLSEKVNKINFIVRDFVKTIKDTDDDTAYNMIYSMCHLTTHCCPATTQSTAASTF